MKRFAVRGMFLLIVCSFFAGCGADGNPGVIPENKDPNSSRAFIENTAGIKQKPSPGKKGAAEMPPQPPK